MSPTKVSFGEERVPGLFKVNGKVSELNKGDVAVCNFEVGESSKVQDNVMREMVGIDGHRSFANAVARSFGGNESRNNKLHFVPMSIIGEGRRVAKMDPILEEGCKR